MRVYRLLAAPDRKEICLPAAVRSAPAAAKSSSKAIEAKNNTAFREETWFAYGCALCTRGCKIVIRYH